MSIYQKVALWGSKFIKRKMLFKYGFNFSPMYRRSTGRVVRVSDDLMSVDITIPLSYKNKNYVNSIFGGSMFSAVDPIPMVQLINIIGDDYVVWDKSAEILFKRPAKQDLYASFSYSNSELLDIKKRISEENEIEIEKLTQLKNKDGSVVYCEVRKKIYIADKEFYKIKRKEKEKSIE